MQVECTKGSLPWRNLKDMDEIGRMKRNCRSDIPLKQLFGGCPREYIDIMRVIDGGRFFDEPNYQRIYTLLRQALKTMQAQEFPYDWERWEEERKKKEEEDKKKEEEDKKKKEVKTGFEDDDKEKKKEKEMKTGFEDDDKGKNKKEKEMKTGFEEDDSKEKKDKKAKK
uniref:Non-specific serine/threonine protein kinase n=1 Tax=Steinernema glaseri TaxID=37863 RepID=A0A1I7YFV8_9BILA